MNLTKAKRAENLKKWKATPPALVKHPLRALHQLFPDFRDERGFPAGRNPVFAAAVRAAQRGDGGKVQAMARAALAA